MLYGPQNYLNQASIFKAVVKILIRLEFSKIDLFPTMVGKSSDVQSTTE